MILCTLLLFANKSNPIFASPASKFIFDEELSESLLVLLIL